MIPSALQTARQLREQHRIRNRTQHVVRTSNGTSVAAQLARLEARVAAAGAREARKVTTATPPMTPRAVDDHANSSDACHCDRQAPEDQNLRITHSGFRIVNQIHAVADLIDGLLTELNKFSSHGRPVQHKGTGQ